MLRLLSRAGGGGTIPPASGAGGRGPSGLQASGGAGVGGVATRAPCSPSGGRPAVPYHGPPLVVGALPPGVRVWLESRGRPGGGGDEGRPVDRSPGRPCRPEPPLCPPRVGNGHGGGHGGRGLHTVLVRRRAPSPGLVRAPLWRAGVGSPVGGDPRGSRQLGAPGRAVCRSSRLPPPRVAVASGEGGGVPSAPGGRRVAPVALKRGGERGGGGSGGPPHHPPPPRPVGRRPAIRCLRRAPPGYTRVVGVAGRPRASGAARSAANGSVRRGGGGSGGEPPRPGSRPCLPQAGLRRGRSVCAVLGAAGPPSVGSGQGGSVRAVHRGRLPRPRCPLTPLAAASSGGVRGRCLFGLPPSALGPEGEGRGSGGGPLVPWRRPLTAEGGRPGGPGPWGQPSAGGSHSSPAPLYLKPDPRAGPRWGPLSPPPSSRGAGRPGAAVRVSGQRLAGCGAVGSPPRLLSPSSLPREVARAPPPRRIVGRVWVGGPSSPPHSLASAVWAVTCAAACVGAGAVAAAGCAGGSASGRGRCAKPGGASCWRPRP